MPLQKTNIPISLQAGIQTKVDPKQVVLGQLLTLENGIFTSVGSINKRNGYDILGTDLENGIHFTEGAAISVFGNELLMFSGNRVYSRTAADNKWIDKGAATSVITTGNIIVRNDSYEQSNPVSDLLSGIEVYAYEDTRGGIRYDVVDTSTSAIIVYDKAITAFGFAPVVVAYNGSIFILYIDSNTIKYRRIDPSLPSTLGNEVVLVNDVAGSNATMSAASNNNRLYISYNGTSHITTFYLDTTLTVQGSTSVSGDANSCVGMAFDANSNITVLYGSSSGTRAHRFNSSMSFIASALLDTTIASAITGSANDTTLVVLYNVPSSIATDGYINSVSISDSFVPSSPSVFKRAASLASNVFSYNDISYVNILFFSALQATYFTVDTAGNYIAKLNFRNAGNIRSRPTLPNVPALSSGIFLFANQIKGRTQAENDTLFTRLGINSSRFDFTSNNNFISAKLGNNLHIVGGIVSSYDGTSVVEHNFHIYPENIVLLPQVSGGHLDAGTYEYLATYEWTDNYGQVQRSTTSIPVQTTTTGSTSSVLVQIPTLRHTSKTNVRIVVYRTEANSTLFYRITSITNPVINDPTIDYITLVDTLNDTSIISNDLVYDTGDPSVGVPLDDSSAPSCNLLVSHQNRIFIAGTSDKNVVQYSKIVAAGSPVQFADELTFKLDARGGDITALGSLDAALVIFKSNSIYYTSGDGLDAAGNGITFSTPQLVSTDVGCSNPNSVVISPVGLMFKSSKGIYLLDRSLSVSYIGKPVEAFNSETITSSTLIENRNQIRFTTQSGPTLVFSYDVGQWSTFTNHESVDSDIWQGNFVMLKSNGSVYVENEGFTDGASGIQLLITTSWLSLAGLQNFQRIYLLTILGDYKGEHKLAVSFAYDFSPYDSDSSIIDATSICAGTHYGDDPIYGGTSPYGGRFVPYQFRIHLSKPKCEAVRITISDIQTENYNEGCALSALSLRVGAKEGNVKLPASSSFGTS